MRLPINTQLSSKKSQNEKKNCENSKCKECVKTCHTIDGCFEKIGYTEWWDTHQRKTTGDQRKQVKPKPKATNFEFNASPISGLSLEQNTKLIKQLTDTQKL